MAMIQPKPLSSELQTECAELIEKITHFPELQDMFRLASIYAEHQQFDRVSWVIRYAHGIRPRATRSWGPAIRTMFPDLFEELESSIDHFMEEKELPDPVSKWNHLNFSEEELNADLGFRSKAGELLDPVFENLNIPGTPFSEARVVTFGSCFAANVYSALLRQNVPCDYFSITEEINTPFSVHGIISHIETGEDNEIVAAYDPARQEQLRASAASFRETLKASTDVILTFGVALAPFKNDKPIFCIPPKDALKTPGVTFQIISVEENQRYMSEIFQAIRRINPGTRIFASVSPVPLTGSPSGNVIVDDFRSKASLRSALDLAIRGFDRTFYWPSFEATKWYPAHFPVPTFGGDMRSTRHVHSWVVDYVIEKFIQVAFQRK